MPRLCSEGRFKFLVILYADGWYDENEVFHQEEIGRRTYRNLTPDEVTAKARNTRVKAASALIKPLGFSAQFEWSIGIN